ncbi:unnamed protein product [Thlaspi arvense]|uniref:Uncharacterized protein n=1 Tax=Thlaspi arvense TaxID=13288 RepID=A0AAU9SEP4_THLAR|nr:unnamed protein product [Thlaspi arvense]
MCQKYFPGLKVVWPELKGVSAIEAKRKVESDNPHVTGIIVPDDTAVIFVNCCNRVLLSVSANNCPNGPVLNIPQMG